jgi:hypothetical protein
MWFLRISWHVTPPPGPWVGSPAGRSPGATATTATTLPQHFVTWCEMTHMTNDMKQIWKILKDIERYWKILKDIEIYWKILKDVNILKHVEIGGRWITWITGITWITWAWLRSLRTKGYESTGVCTIRFLSWCNICFLTYVVRSMRGQVCNILRPIITSWRRTSMETIPSPSTSKNEITASWQRAQANNSSWHVWTQSSKADGAGNHVRIEASSAIQSSHVAIWFSVLSTGAC